MSDSVGKISLEIDLQSGLSKQINSVANSIGKHLSNSIQSQVKGIGNSMSFSLPKKAFKIPKRTYSTKKQQIDYTQLAATLDNVNDKIDVQKRKLAELKAQYNEGISEKIQHQIEQQERVMQASEVRIEALRVKLKDLKESYENSVTLKRKNKLAEEISKTEATILRLSNQSDKALHKIIELEQGLNSSQKNALREKIVNTEAALIRLGQQAEKLKEKMNGAGRSVNDLGRKAGRSEKPVRKLGDAFLILSRRTDGLSNSIQRATTRILKQVFVFALLYKAINGLHSYMGSVLRTNNQFMRSLAQIRTNLQVAFMPIYQSILPALNTFMQWLAKATTYIASFISALFGKSYKQSFEAAKGLNAARAEMERLGKSSKKTSKATKEALSNLAGFDEINVLSKDKPDKQPDMDTESSIAPLVAPDLDTSVIDGKMSALVAKIKDILQPSIDALKRLWIAMDPFKQFVAQGAIDFYNLFLKPVGAWVFNEAIPRFIDALAAGFAAVNWSKINDGLAKLWKALTPFAINVGEGLLWFWEKVLVPLGAWTMNNIVPVFLDILTNAITIVNNVIEALKPLALWLFESFLKPLAAWTGGIIVSVLEWIADALGAIGDWIKEHQKWVESIAIVILSFAAAWKIVTIAMSAWNAVVIIWNGIGSIATAITYGFRAAILFLTSPVTIAIAIIGSLIAIGVLLWRNWDEVSEWLKKVWEGIKEAAVTIWGAITSSISSLWNGLKNLASSIFNSLKTLITGIFNGIKTTVLGIWGAISSALSGLWNGMSSTVSSIFNTIKSAIVNAFEFVKSKVTSIWNGIWSMIKTVINSIIDGINKMIRGLNKLKFDIPDWVPGIGGGTFGINIPEIPKLARGGIIDQPTLAMVGEAGKEVVMPLENNTGWIDNLAGKISAIIGQQGTGAGGGDITIPVYIGTDMIDEIIVKAEQMRNIRNNRRK